MEQQRDAPADENEDEPGKARGAYRDADRPRGEEASLRQRKDSEVSEEGTPRKAGPRRPGQVALRVDEKGLLAIAGAKQVPQPPISHRRHDLARVDGHPADRIDREFPICVHSMGGKDGDAIRNVLEPALPSRAKRGTRRRRKRLLGRLGQQDFASLRCVGDPRGQVDAGSEPVAVSLDGCSGMHTDPHRRSGMSGKFLHDAQTEDHGLLGVIDPGHDLIADRLDLLRTMVGEQTSDAGREALDDLCCRLVSMGLGQRRITGEISEEECVLV